MDEHTKIEQIEAAFFLAVGQAVRAWSSMENSMWLLAGALLNVDQFRARIVMSSFTSGRTQRMLLIRLAETYLEADPLSRLRGLMERVGQLSKDRNAIAHDPFSIGSKEDEITLIADHFGKSKRGALVTKFERFPRQRIPHSGMAHSSSSSS